MSATVISPPPVLPYAEEHFDTFDAVYDVLTEIWELGKERTAGYLYNAGIHAETINLKYRNGKCCRRYETPNGKRGTVAYDYRTHELAVNGRLIKN